MKIDVTELRRVTMRLFDHIIETRGVRHVEIEQLFYWELDPADAFGFSDDRPDAAVGSLADDWDFLKRLLEDDASPVAYQLSELAPLLSYLGYRLGIELAEQGG